MDKFNNEYIRGTYKVAKIHEKLTESRLRWYGDVMRRDDDYMIKKVMNIEDGKRGRGRPPITWLRTIKNDIIASNTTQETSHNPHGVVQEY
ncbi:jg837 [Pararge aegeria aegeria]|uniref:Jg837 protein n=1 Tax=Pararge aegeria aegeria TaxID=348720 RepID=A0A8S4S9P0_9NEOP|nr:jg837 [Pararge aegeria aegeria]